MSKLGDIEKKEGMGENLIQKSGKFEYDAEQLR